MCVCVCVCVCVYLGFPRWCSGKESACQCRRHSWGICLIPGPKDAPGLLLLFIHLILSDSAAAWTATHQAPLSFTIFQSLLRFMTTEPVMLPNHLILYCPLLLLPSIFPSIKVFSNESALHIWWPKYCGFSFNTSPSNEYMGLISIRIDWHDLLAVQWTLRVFNTTTQKHQLYSAQPYLWSNSPYMDSHVHISVHEYWENHSFEYTDLCQQSDIFAF